MKKEDLQKLISPLESLRNNIKAMFNEAPIEAGESAPAPIVAEAADGTQLQIKGELAQGSEVTILNQDGTEVPAPNGDIQLKDGSTISILEGKITEVKAPQDPAQSPADQPAAEMKEQPFEKELKALTERINALTEKAALYEKANAVLMAKIEQSNAVISETFKVVEKIAGLPEEKPIEKKGNVMFNKHDKLAHLAQTLKTIKPSN